MKTVLGNSIRAADLYGAELQLVQAAWDVSHKAYCYRSNFPVGAAILARNDAGVTRVFAGCNVENAYFPATICAERNAATTAVAAGYREFLAVSVVCPKYLGGSPCGLCRQVLFQFGPKAKMLNIVSQENDVRCFTVAEMLPAASGHAKPIAELPDRQHRRIARQVNKLALSAYVPYSKQPRGAVLLAQNAQGKIRAFPGVSEDNASYGGSILAERVAVASARTAGYSKALLLAVSVDDPRAANPVEGECLQVIRELGQTDILLVARNDTAVSTTLDDLLPDSFGPECL